MTEDVFSWADGDETTFAQGRLPERTYLSRGFPIEFQNSPDFGQPARFVHKVFDTAEESIAELDGTTWTITLSEPGRYQLKLLMCRESGNVRELWIQRVPAPGSTGKVKNVLNLKREDAMRLIELLRNLDAIPIEGEQAVRIDDALLREVLAAPGSLSAAYHRDPTAFRELISNDETARDVIAVAHRREQVQRFRALLEDDGFFDQEAAIIGRGPEAVWQDLFEKNPWMLGITLSGQLLTSWSNDKLEQIVAGQSIGSPGKRIDALMRTTGMVRSMVFAEIKTHRTSLLGHKEYRSGCWPPSIELAGAACQTQGTVHLATNQLNDRLLDVSNDGSDIPGSFTYLFRPRSFLVIGQLGELRGAQGGDHPDKIRSFELYRRHLDEPEVITFDELLARAEWLAEASKTDG